MADLKVNGNFYSNGEPIGFGVNVPFTLGSGHIATCAVFGTAFTTSGLFANTVWAVPFCPSQDIISSAMFIEITAGVAGALARILVYEEVDGAPYQAIYYSSALDCSTIGIKTAVTVQNFQANKRYFLALQTNSNPTYRALATTNIVPYARVGYGSAGATQNYNCMRIPFLWNDGVPTLWGGTETLLTASPPLIGIIKQ